MDTRLFSVIQPIIYGVDVVAVVPVVVSLTVLVDKSVTGALVEKKKLNEPEIKEIETKRKEKTIEIEVMT